MTERSAGPEEATPEANESAAVLPASDRDGAPVGLAQATPGVTSDRPIPTSAQGNDLGMEAVSVEAESPGAAFVYALGQVEPRFPTLAVEKEFAQVAGQGDASGLTDRQALQSLLSEPSNRYLARQLCWVFTIEGLETYILHPRVVEDLDLLVEAVRPAPKRTDIDVVIGVMGPIAPPELCNALMVPIVVFDHLYSFDVDTLLGAIPRPEKAKVSQWEAATEEVFSRVTQMNDNAGATDADRALNYLSVRYPGIYHKAAEKFAANASLTAVEVRPSRLSSTRNVVDVIFTYTDRTTDVTDKLFVRVDVTEEFPFLVTKISPYFERGA